MSHFEKNLPSKEKFYVSVRGKKISNKDHKHAPNA